tara:strand:+ start:67 stop:366 length:300 start_codon:yes stop_codon:yes gene_type:complete
VGLFFKKEKKMSEENTESVTALRLLNIETIHSEGNFEFKIEVTEEFEKWFKEKQGLKKWSEKRFNEWFKGLVSAGIPEVHSLLLSKTIDASTGEPLTKA